MSAPLAELAGRFAAMLTLLAALGAGPASLLPAAWPGRARAALAPMLGLCLAACGFTTLEWFFPADKVAVALPPACALSLATAAWRTHRRRAGAARPAAARPEDRSERRRVAAGLAVAQVLAICAAAFLPAATALAAHSSVGPMSYEVFDGPGYVANAQAASTASIHTASTRAGADNYVQRWWGLDTASPNRLDYAPVVAAVDVLLGLDATQTYAADLLAVLAVGGLGCYAAVLVSSPRRRGLFATLAGAAFGGSFFLQLVFDGSQAALTGLVVLVPLVLLLSEAARAPSGATLGVVALVVAGLATLYPIFLVPVALATLPAGVFALARARRAGRLPAGSVARWGRRLAVVAAGAAALDVVATVRDARSLSSIVTGGGIFSSFPAYHLGAGVVASWLLQTRDLYGVAFGPQSPLQDVVAALVVPVAVLVVALPPLRRSPVAWLALLLVAVSLVLGAYEALHNGCGYCEDRSLLSSVPPLVFLVFTGLGTALSSARLAARAGLVLVVGAYLGLAAYDAANARARYGGGSIYVTTAERSLVGTIPAGAGPVELEGFGAAPSSIAAEPYVYELLVADGDEVSAATAQEGAGLAEDWGPEPLRPPWFRPGYRLVLTRLSHVHVARRLLASAGQMALEERRGPVDASVEAGLAYGSARARLPTVTGPLVFLATRAGGTAGGQESLHARFGVSRPSLLDPSATVRLLHGGGATVCVPLPGPSPTRTARVRLPVAAGLRLEAMVVRRGPC